MDSARDSTGWAGSHTALDTLAWLIEEAFEGDPSHSLLANLHDLKVEDWTTLPPGSSRSIADILEHVGWSKWMYEDYAFGTSSMQGDQPPLVPAGGARSRPHDELLAWLIDGHRRWLESVRALRNDSELDRDRLTNWGERLPTRIIIRIMIAHDLYHAGEINHLRALLQGTDRWPYD
ncbi:MAG TPA: DinB family protein [Anaerolineales bacterium]|nr:DinB family protein [Anaerolineales bacterium]